MGERAEREHLYEAIAQLDARSRQVMLARAAGEMYDTIAERLGVTRQRIQQIEQQARSRLLKLLQNS